MKDKPLKSVKNGIGLGTAAGGPESNQEGEGGSNDTLCTFNVDLCPSPPGSKPSVQAVMSLWGRENRWEVAMALQREEGSLREHGEEH